MGKRHEIDPRAEFQRAEFGDRRLNERLLTMFDAVVDAPSRSFPSAMPSDAQLEGTYRFFKNEKVTLQRLIEPHIEATVGRAAADGSLLVLHDTTEFRFGGASRREGLGVIANGGQGFYGHFALAVSDDGKRTPLGLAGLLTYTRDQATKRIREVDYLKRRLVPRESVRWGLLFDEVEDRFGHLKPIHVMDREADDFELFTKMVERGSRFVVRMTTQRRRRAKCDSITITSPYVEDIARALPHKAKREVPLSRRTQVQRGARTINAHPNRARRVAKLEFGAAVVDLAPPRALTRQMKPLTVAIVHVCEKSPPAGEAPVEWTLATTEPVGTADEILNVIDRYRARWLSEEYFKALKTGCAVERRQLESADALRSVLGLFAPIAVRILALRSRARLAPDEPATRVLDGTELAALRTLARSPLPRSPTVRDALFAIAELGGHLRRNGEPGWQTLCRGWEKLEIAVQVVTAISDGKRRK
jgi:transposase-like protein